jgi:hypothetical protein
MQGTNNRSQSTGPRNSDVNITAKPKSLFDVVMRDEARRADRRQQKTPPPSRSHRTASRNLPTAVRGGSVKSSSRPQVIRPEQLHEAAPAATSSADSGAAAFTPANSVSAALAGVTAAPGNSQTVVLAPLAPAQVLFRRRPRSARQRAEDATASSAETKRGGHRPSRQWVPLQRIIDNASMGGRGLSVSALHAVATVSAGLIVLCGCLLGLVLHRRQTVASSAARADWEVREYIRSLSAGPPATPESESVVDRAAAGSNPLLPSTMLDSFATPYWKPDAVTVLDMLGIAQNRAH